MNRVHAATKAVRPGQRPRTPPVSSRAAERTPENPTSADLGSRLRRARLLGHGPVPAVQRKEYEDGDNTYHTETFDTNRERPKKVEGKVHWVSTAGRGAAPPAIARYDPTARDYDVLLGYDGGHVLGLEAGGADESHNVVPMLPKFNRDTWRKVEQTLVSNAMFLYSGMSFRFTINVTYADNTAQVPDSLTLLGYADVPEKKRVKGKWKPTGKVTYNKQVMNITKSQPGDIELTPGPTTEETEAFEKTRPTAGKVVNELKKRKDYKDDEFLQYVAKKRHLPESEAQEYPDDPADRPYEYLDVLALAGQVYSDANFMPRKEFSSLQRTLILKYNMAKNGGVLRSDDPLDPHQNLSERGAADFPEVDHIIPKSQGGSNFFSNARLVSWQLNNKEDRVKDISPFIHISRISYPALTGNEDAETLKVKGILALKKHIHETGLDELTQGDAVSFFSMKYYFSQKKIVKLAQAALAQMVTDGFLTQSGLKYTVA